MGSSFAYDAFEKQARRDEERGGGFLGGLHSEILKMMGTFMKRNSNAGRVKPYGETEAPCLHAVTCDFQKKGRGGTMHADAH